MTKKDIVKRIAADMGVSQHMVYQIVQQTFDEIIAALVSDKRIELRNFGVFEAKVRAPRKARNPRTNERLEVPERVVVAFKPGKEMNERVGQLAVEDVRSVEANQPADEVKHRLKNKQQRNRDEDRPSQYTGD